MFVRARKERDCWLLFNSWDHQFKLPCRENYSGCEIAIGVLGTGTREKITKITKAEAIIKGKTRMMAEMFAALQQPIYLIDTRRTGVGGSSSWPPREFATLIPEFLAGRITYAYLHLPCLAPSLALREEARQAGTKSWQEFRERFINELSQEGLDVGRAFVEAAAAKSGMAVFLCAEADEPGFDGLAQEEQNHHYCHRFTLAKQIANRLKNAYGGVSVKRVPPRPGRLPRTMGEAWRVPSAFDQCVNRPRKRAKFVITERTEPDTLANPVCGFFS